jgi:protein ImuB
MDRWGCIRFPELPLQVALLRRQDREVPFAVVRDEKPSSPLLFVNEAAAGQGLRPGMRYTAALSVVPKLQVDTVTEPALAEVRRGIVELLAGWSPQIEPCSFDAEVFWINASGLSALHGAPEQWGAALRDHLAGLGYRVDLVIGWSRRGSYVLARSWRRSAVVASAASEGRAVAASPVAALPLLWPVRDLLEKIRVRTVAELDGIPRGELTRRLGRDALADLEALNDVRPLQPVPLAATTVQERHWDDGVSDLAGLEEVLWELLRNVLDRLRPRAHLVEELTFMLQGEDGERAEVLKPAQATSNPRVWRRLLELRLASVALTSPVTGVTLDTVSVPPPPPAADLFDRPPRDLKRGAKALALIRARWGNDSVVRAALADSHVPEQSFVWQPAGTLETPKPGPTREGTVRRIFDQPVPEVRGSVLAGPFIAQDAGSAMRRYWFVAAEDQVLWMRQDGWDEPRAAGFAD